uniref:Uncharacterized protein n=1 Tax=Romanomermis culicivorax TaxID=13658 RepID=A0A915JHI7_ROMCU
MILRHRVKSRIDSESNLSALKCKLNDKIMKALTFITTWHTLTFTLASFSTIILNKLPYRGAQYGPYFLAPYYTNGIACFLCYALYVSRFRECLKSLVDRGYLWMGRQDIPINVLKGPLNMSK